MLGDDRYDLLERRYARNNAVGQVRAIEARDLNPWLLHLKERDDIIPNAGGRGGRESDEWHGRKSLAQDREFAILRSKIMAPFRDTVGLVHGDETDVPSLEGCEHLFGYEAFRRQIENVVPAACQILPSPSVLLGRQRRIEESRRYADLLQAVDLILHESDQRRDDDCEPVVDDRGQLIAQRLATARGQQRQDIFAGQ